MRTERATRADIAGCGGMPGEAAYQLWSAQSEVMATDIDVNESRLSHASSECARLCK